MQIAQIDEVESKRSVSKLLCLLNLFEKKVGVEGLVPSPPVRERDHADLFDGESIYGFANESELITVRILNQGIVYGVKSCVCD